MTSTLTLYYSCLVEKDKNFALDNAGAPAIATYLSTLTSVSITRFQYVKQGLSISIKIDKAQTALEMGADTYDLNYCKIQNGDENPCYYFIISKKWISQETLQLVLAMDTINTFRYDIDYTISPKTFIKRQHKDRFTKYFHKNKQDEVIAQEDNVTSYSASYTLIGDKQTIVSIEVVPSAPGSVSVLDVTYTLENGILNVNITTDDGYAGDELFVTIKYNYTKIFRVIDLQPENINPLLYKKSETIFSENSLDWYLIYMNQNDPSDTLVNPVYCFICASEQIQIAYSGGSQNIVPSNMVEDKIYYVRQPSLNPADEITLTTDDSTTFTTSRPGGSEALICFKRKNNKILVTLLSADNYGDISIPSPTSWKETSFLSSDTNPLLVRIADVFLQDVAQVENNAYTTSQYITLQNASILINSIKDLDRTNSRIIKAIKLPYNPINMTYNSGIWDFDRTIYTYDSTMRMIRLLDLSTKFDRDMVSLHNPLEILYDTPTYTDGINRAESFESKLFHSAFFQSKFVYDSFGFSFALERVNLDNLMPQYESGINFTINYVVTSTINSRFMFTFTSYDCSGLEAQDYNNVLPIARNNEITLYNQQYINYLRNGFNYDVKNKERQQATNWIATGLSAVGSIASFVGGGPLGAVAGISLATNTLTNLVGAINNTMQSETNLEAKQQQLKAQTSSVFGSDDVDLMSKYTQNRAKFEVYEVSSRMKKCLFDLFHYCGYVANFQDKPNISSRKMFNYVQASLVVNHTNNLPTEIVDDIKEKFEAGVTFLHLVNGTFDFNQEKENIEVSIL